MTMRFHANHAVEHPVGAMPALDLHILSDLRQGTTCHLDADGTQAITAAMERGCRDVIAHPWEALAAGTTFGYVPRFPPVARLWYDLHVRDRIDSNAFSAAEDACCVMRDLGRSTAKRIYGSQMQGFEFHVATQQSTDLDPRRVLGPGRQFLVDRLTRRMTEGEDWAAAALALIAPYLDEA